jgi:hypothetical protein
MPQTVLLLGASPKPERYAHRALLALTARGHRVVPVHPVHASVEGIPCVKRLEDVCEKIDTVTLYVGPDTSTPLTDALIRLRPGRVIFNPGTENPPLERRLQEARIPTLRACTLVMLSTGQFDMGST